MKKWDDLDEAIIGPASIWTNKTQVEVLVYNAETIRNILMSRDGMDFEEAREFIEYNIEGAYIGVDTPILVWPNDLYRVTDHDTEH
jgi:predicted RNase H-like nuclease